jgi:para-nitrobenzyl esterase
MTTATPTPFEPEPEPEPVSRPEVRVSTGVLRGSREGELAVFRGIPYAEPPVGAYRFAAPQPAESWEGVRQAVAYGPPAPQAGASVTGAARPEAEETDHGWLTVNVWAPEPAPGAGLPVMVWIHGGAYMLGSSSQSDYDGGRLARDGGVVVVTLNYRLGMEGFAQIEGAPANRGLLDQVAALEWVRDNIGAFGGDPARVTVFGESAGAGSVAALLVMPRAAGLFHRAIAQSVPGTFFSAELAAGLAAACAAELGLKPTVADLSTVPPERLPAAGDAVAARMRGDEARWGGVAYTSVPYSPVVDGEVLPVAPWEGLAAGAARDVELIVGHNRDEYRLFLAMSGALGKVEEEQTETALRLFAPGGAKAYREAFPDAGPEQLFELVNSDWLFRMPSLHLAQAQLTGGGRTHLYELTWTAPGLGGVLGACHGLDVPLVLGNLDVTDGLAALVLGSAPGPEAETLSTRMRTAWAAFAATGDPGWPAYSVERGLTQVYDVVPGVAAYPEEASRLLWQQHVFGPLGLP